MQVVVATTHGSLLNLCYVDAADAFREVLVQLASAHELLPLLIEEEGVLSQPLSQCLV